MTSPEPTNPVVEEIVVGGVGTVQHDLAVLIVRWIRHAGPTHRPRTLEDQQMTTVNPKRCKTCLLRLVRVLDCLSWSHRFDSGKNSKNRELRSTFEHIELSSKATSLRLFLTK